MSGFTFSIRDFGLVKRACAVLIACACAVLIACEMDLERKCTALIAFDVRFYAQMRSFDSVCRGMICERMLSF